MIAIGEGLTGMILVLYPAFVSKMLFGEEIVGAGLFVGRLTGACLLALAIACWPVSGSSRGVWGMFTFGVLAIFCLALAAMTGHAGLLLWPAIVAHALLSILLLRAWLAEQRIRQGSDPMGKN